jgi:hypothetical protein
MLLERQRLRTPPATVRRSSGRYSLRCIPATAIAASEVQKAGTGTDLWMPVVGNSVPGNVSSTQSRLAFGCAPQDKGTVAFEVDRRQPPYARQEASTVSIRLEEETGGEKDKSDDDGTAEEREIWQATAVTEEDLEDKVCRTWSTFL